MEQGIKNTKEVIVALNKLVVKLAPLLANGIQVGDLIEGFNAINGDPVAKAEFEAALKDIHLVDDEIKDISLSEGIELVMVQAKILPELLAALKKA